MKKVLYNKTSEPIAPRLEINSLNVLRRGLMAEASQYIPWGEVAEIEMEYNRAETPEGIMLYGKIEFELKGEPVKRKSLKEKIRFILENLK